MPRYYKPRRYKGKYRSQFEERFANNLTKENIKFQYEPKKFVYWIKLPRSRHTCRNCSSSNNIWRKGEYEIDWYLPEYDLWVETKGRWDSKDRKKVFAFIEQYPDKNYIILFHSDSYIRKGSKTRYSMYCEKYKIPYKIIGRNASVPKEILK